MCPWKEREIPKREIAIFDVQGALPSVEKIEVNIGEYHTERENGWVAGT